MAPAGILCRPIRQPAPAPSHRHHLHGRRTIAVMAVPGDRAGGVIGVDMLLVPSGCLIIQRIGAALSEGRFLAGRFWLPRVRRLLPAMLPVPVLALVSALILKGEGAVAAFAGDPALPAVRAP